MRPQTELSRCLIMPREDPAPPPKGDRKRRRTWRDLMNPGILRVLAPYAHPSLTFDIETTITAHSGQVAKVGFYQERGLTYAERVDLFSRGELTVKKMDHCWREGVFYNPDPAVNTEEEINTIKQYAMKHGFECMTVQEFIKKRLYRMEYLDSNRQVPEPKLIIGHNPAFDLGALSHHTAGCSAKKMYGGLSLGLCDCRKDEIDASGKYMKCDYHPNIRIKQLNKNKHFYEVCAKANGFDRKGKKKWVNTELEVLDTVQLAGALLGAGCDKRLGSLCRMLDTSHQKMETESHGFIDEAYLEYAYNDVLCTWDLWVKLRDVYKKYDLKTRITKLVSEASIGKAIFRKFGIQSFFGYDKRLKKNTRNLEFDLRDFGAAMEGYIGGRSQAWIRHKITECMLPDFRSQYPSVNGLMKLQDLLLAVSVDVERGVDTPARKFLETVGIDDFQFKETWPRLRGFAKVRPNGDVLPFRCAFEKDDADDDPMGSINVAFPYIHSSCDRWVSFADVCYSKFVTGKCPEILETIEFKPIGRQPTNVVEVFGNPLYKIDLTKDDLFIRVIELRQTVKNDQKKLTRGTPEWEHLEAIQLALKLIANATAYGALVETIVDERAEQATCDIYHGGEKSVRVARKGIPIFEGAAPGFKVETPGEYAAPYGGLIPAAGRLLIGIAEVLFRNRGLSYAYADTDAIAPACPDDMPSDEFRRRVLEVAGKDGWFEKLSPYSDGAPLFAVEDVNFRLLNKWSGKIVKSQPERLFCLVRSAKRYVLFNVSKPTRKYPKGQTIIRKISGHGLGGLRFIDDYDPSAHKLTAPDHVAAPVIRVNLKKAIRLKQAFEAGNPEVTAEMVEAARRDVRDYGSLVHGSTPRLLCDLWRIVVDCFRESKENQINDIIGSCPNCKSLSMVKSL